MANQRMRITCVCGEHLHLAKRMGSEFYVYSTIEDDLSTFFSEHKECGLFRDHFDISYETNRDWEIGKSFAEQIGHKLQS